MSAPFPRSPGPVLLALAVGLTAAGPAAAQVRIHRTLTLDDGLVQSQVRSLCEDREGYLWLGTNDGASRWDGAEFASFQSRDGLPAGQVYAIHQAADGVLFFGTERGVGMLANGRIALPPPTSGLRETPVHAIVSAPDGSVLFLHSKGIVRRAPGGAYGALPVRGAPAGRSFLSLLAARDGTLWIGTAGDGALVLPPDGGAARGVRNGLAGRPILALAEGRDGAVYLGTEAGLSVFRNGELARPALPGGLGAVLSIAALADGAVVLGTASGGLVILRPGPSGPSVERVTTENGLPWDRVDAVYETRGGAVWVGTDRGAALYDRGLLATWKLASGLPDDVVWAIAEPAPGDLRVGTSRGLARLRGGRWEPFGTGLPDTTVRALAPGRPGELWAGTQFGGAVLVKQGSTDLFGTSDDLPDPFVRAIHRDRDGAVWLGTQKGLVVLRDGRIEPAPRGSGLGDEAVASIAEAADGTLYFGTLGGGIFAGRGGAFRHWTKRDGLADDTVWSVRIGRDGSVYAGTARGLSVLKNGRFRSFDTSRGLTNDTVYCVLEDAAGRVYLSTNRGVNVLDRSVLETAGTPSREEAGTSREVAGTSVRTIERADGLAGNEGNLGACYEDAAGRLWFGAVGGVSVYDPSREPPRREPPRVRVTGLSAFGEPVPLPAAGGAVRLGSGRSHLTFSFAGIDLAAPHRVVYRYRLEGFDRGWTETDRRTVQYTNLDPGRYRFAVQAASGGPWSLPAGLRLELPAPLWRRWWVLLGAALALGSAAALLVRARVRQLLAIERLRTSLAADLHDHIGAGLTEIAILTEIAARRGGNGGPPGPPAELAKVADIARQLVDRMNDIVWLVNPRRDSLHELFLRLKDSYAELFSQAGVLFRATNLRLFEGVRLPMAYRENLYLIFKEALNNSLRHSGCTEIELEVALHGPRREVVLKDDGRGFSSDSAAGSANGSMIGGDGLDNMRRRAGRIGGALAIDSAPDRGTEVRFTGPIG